MVGVPKSNGCKTCKKRRLKCDESWPECLRCQKIKQPCPGTSSLLTFKDGRPKTIGPISALATEANASKVLVPLPSKCQLGNIATDLTVLDTKWSKTGALSQKWRIKIRQEPPFHVAPTQQHELDAALPTPEEQSPDVSKDFSNLNISYCPANSVRYRLTRAFIATLEVPEAGYRITSFGKYMRDIPRYVGESAALDAATACLANAHSNVMRHPESCGKQVADPVLYLKALRRLQEAIMDPKTGTSTCTLAATILLGIVETLGGVRQDSKALSHAGGTTKLIEMRGPSNHLDDFANNVLRSQRGKIILQSLWSGNCCFLESEEWQAAAFMGQKLTETVLLHDQVIKQLTYIPRILKGFRELHSPSPMVPPDDTLFRLKEMRYSLTDLGYKLEPRLHNGSIATEVPSRFGNTLVPIYWNFTEQSEATIYSHFWTLVIVVNQMFGEMTGTHDHEPICRDAAYNICKLYEHLWPYRPFANTFLVMSFSVAYPWLTYDLQTWIIAALNELSGAKSTGARWSYFDVEHLAGVLTGKVPPVTSSI